MAKKPRQLSLKGVPRGRALLSQRAYARHRGVSEAAVRRAVRDKRITPGPGGKIDPIVADRQWNASTDPGKPWSSNLPARRPVLEAPEPPADGPTLPGHLSAFAEARAQREKIRAAIEMKQLQRLEGRLVDVDKVRAAAFAHTRTARDQLLGIPDRLAPVLAPIGDAAEIHRILLEEVRRVAADLARPIVPAAPGEGKKA